MGTRRERTKIKDKIKNLIKEERKGEQKINHSRYINNLVCEVMQSDKLINEYETR